MSRMIELPNLPIGFSLTQGFDGDTIIACRKRLLTSEDGGIFIKYLEGISLAYAPLFSPGGIAPSQVDHFLAIISPDRRATVYCNELRFASRIRVNRMNPNGINAGDVIGLDDIGDVEDLEIYDATGNLINIPIDHGFDLILSHGWRKALIFDYSIFEPNGIPRRDNLPRVFGHVYTRLWFQEMYAITDAQWTRLFEWGWFPFVGLTHNQRRQILSFTLSERYPASLFADCCRSFMVNIEDRLNIWKRSELMETHLEFLKTGFKRFREGDHMSCISLIYPRIEGLMRCLFVEENPGQQADQNEMVNNLVENQFPHSLLLPQRFGEYLRMVYFQKFNLSSGEIPLSRHSHGHGVSKAEDYDLIRAAVGFMIFDQLFHYLSD